MRIRFSSSWNTLLTVAFGAALLLPAAPARADEHAGRKDAKEATRQHDGSASQHEGSASDARVRGRIVTRLAASRALEGTDIWVSVENRHATLRGVVQDGPTAERALRIAQSTDGVRTVTSTLEIDPAAAERPRVAIRDENLAEAVARTLVKELFPDAAPKSDWMFGWEVDGFSWEFDVDVDQGDVTLSGTVPSYEDLIRVISATRRVPGVRSVHSRLGFRDPVHWAGVATAGAWKPEVR